MDSKTKAALAIVAGLLGAFILGGVAFGVVVPVVSHMHGAAFDDRAVQSRDGYGPRAWGGDANQRTERGPGMMEGRRGGGMMGPRGQAPADPRFDGGTWDCPNFDEQAGAPLGRFAPPGVDAPADAPATR